jgi:hypothetical protein
MKNLFIAVLNLIFPCQVLIKQKFYSTSNLLFYKDIV